MHNRKLMDSHDEDYLVKKIESIENKKTLNPLKAVQNNREVKKLKKELETRKKKKQQKRILIICFSVLLAMFTFIGIMAVLENKNGGGSSSNIIQEPDIPLEAQTDGKGECETADVNSLPLQNGSTFEIYFLDVGQGDAAVVLCDDEAMIIDGGNNKESNYIYSFLKKHDINHLKYIIASHPDADHVGGLSGALNYASVSTALCTTTDNDTETFCDFKSYLEKQEIEITVPNVGDEYSLGSASFSVLAPKINYEKSDNTSLIIRIAYGKTSFLFVGDAEAQDEAELVETGIDIKSTVLKVAHHGSDSSTTKQFLNKVNPQYAIISVGGDNIYGHPTEAVLARLAEADIKTYRTDMQGTIHCESNGEIVTFDVAKNTSDDIFSIIGGYTAWIEAQNVPDESTIPGENAENTQSEDNELETNENICEYVANTNTGKFHYSDCPHVRKMKESNKAYIEGTREDLLSMGYSPCANCHP